MSAEIKIYSNAIKNLVTKHNIDSLMSFLEEQCKLIQDLTAKIPMLDEKINASQTSIDKLNDKINNFEEHLACLKSQDEL